MAGRGPQPKDPKRRARTNSDPVPTTVLRFEQAQAPTLPRLPKGQVWPARTKSWWAMWKRSPQADLFSATDWDFLLDTARIHAAFWSGDLSVAGELRLRVAKFGATPEDRARLRMTFAEADEKDSKRVPAVESARERYGTLRALPAAGE